MLVVSSILVHLIIFIHITCKMSLLMEEKEGKKRKENEEKEWGKMTFLILNPTSNFPIAILVIMVRLWLSSELSREVVWNR